MNIWKLKLEVNGGEYHNTITIKCNKLVKTDWCTIKVDGLYEIEFDEPVEILGII